MPPQSRFGASKYRNAVPHIPPREEWYRSHLPSFTSSSSSSSALSAFSNELKTNREYIATLTQAGELSYRGYKGGNAGAIKVGSGGGVGDWDLGRVEGGRLVVGGLDGAIAVYTLPPTSGESGPPVLFHTIPPSSSPITHLVLHPTTPDILLASTPSAPLRIYDLSSASHSAPVIELAINEPKGIWSAAWSTDGRLIAIVGKSGTVSIFDPRAGKEAIATKSLSFSIQALKPAKVVWVGADLFITSFSKSRNRQYALLSPAQNLSTTFSQSLDTSPSVLIPLVDEERRIIYTASKGDMTLRQIELSGPAGYQETLHPLPSPLASQGLALAHPGCLDVMKAEIAQVLVPALDKDGETIVPIGVRVPRRQLIDYHDDLFPDIQSTVSEQSAAEWLSGQDKIPLPISLDPSRRGAWESQLANLAQRSQVKAVPEVAKQLNGEQTSTPISEPTATSQQSAPPQDTASHTSPPPTASPPPPASSDNKITSETQQPAAVDAPETPTHPSLVPLEDGETYASTSYKVRIIADHIAEQLHGHRASERNSPLFVGLQGPQGCGKTTLCTTLLQRLEQVKDIKAAVLSLDDLYKTHDGLQALAQKHSDNALLSGRGPSGTHDVDLAKSVLQQVEAINEKDSKSVDLPIFDKSLCNGEGDRSSETIKIEGPLDVFILEGWSMGFGPLPESALVAHYEDLLQSPQKFYSPDHPFSSLHTINRYLQEFSATVYPFFSALVQVEPVSYEHVFAWRLEQEHAMKAANGGKGMTDEQVRKFVERYMPGYELWSQGIWSKGTPWEGKGLKLRYGKSREVLEITRPGNSSHEGAAEVESAESAASPSESKGSDKPAASSHAQAPETDLKPQSQKATPPAEQKSSSVVASSSNDSRPASHPTADGNAPRYNPSWSRKFLAAKAPLIPTYDSLPSLSSLHQDSNVLKTTPHLAFFPIQGTGGRLGVHPLKKKGRMPVGGEGYLSAGVEIVDFDVDLFEGRVAVACEDGVVRVWAVSPDGVQGVGPEASQVLKGKGVDKITQIAFHPTAKDLLVGLTNDHGQTHMRFWDLSSGEEAKQIEIPTSGAFNFSSSTEGDRVAIATKEGQIMIIDPREPGTVLVGKAHDSPRSFQITWIDSEYLISVGFSRGSQRKINLYRLDNSSKAIETISSITIDVSPSVLFPVYDPDTSILYVWGKGERVIQAYEIHPQNDREPIAKLPSYTAGSPQVAVAFLPKRVVDVKKVEVAKALRLTAKTLEEVTFSIPRNKPEFFQDDIYVPTLDVESPSTSAESWLGGSNAQLKRLNLALEGMIPLSQAPKTNTAAKSKFVPASDIMSEEAKKKKEMDELFAKAKIDESSDEDDEPKRGGLPPPDDDW